MTDRPRVGYVVSRFPKTTETFIVREMESVVEHGWDVSVFAITHERNQIRQPGVDAFLGGLAAISDLSVGAALAAQVRLVLRRPRRATTMWWRAISGNIRSPKFLARAVIVAWGTPALAEVAERAGVGHLHAHWGTHSALLGHLIGHVNDVPYTVTLHAHDLHVDQTMLARKLDASAHVVTISEHNAQLIRTQFPSVADRTSVVHCGVDVTAIRPAPEGSEELSGTARIACVAGLRGFKGHRHLLAALDELHRRGVDVACDLVGDGPLRDELERLAGPDVVFHGAMHVDDALDVVRRATLFVLPSIELEDGRRDGIPVALMEAMALGIPVVSTSVSGIPELVVDESTGVLVPPADPVALADAIQGLLDDVDRRRALARYARRLIEQDFDIADSGAQMCALFDIGTADREVDTR